MNNQISFVSQEQFLFNTTIFENILIGKPEATAFIDPENEEKMNKAISHVIQDKTVIIIAHRLPSIVSADQIVVLNNGNIVAKGSHKELLEKCDEYKKMWSAQKGAQEWKIKEDA